MATMTTMPKGTAEQKQCPVCGSIERLAETASNYMKAKGWVEPDFEYAVKMIQGSAKRMPGPTQPPPQIIRGNN